MLEEKMQNKIIIRVLTVCVMLSIIHNFSLSDIQYFLVNTKMLKNIGYLKVKYSLSSIVRSVGRGS